ncbi:MAG TPA: CDP-alcohol phosphatidyltransferase family protein [Bacteroidales bacterium]|nr:CDP-alcohol phosphatidyltransferase family protein [Bacteroidales bacterium]
MFLRSKILSSLPNFITILNLISGSVGIFLVFHDKIIWACIMIYIAALFDFFDGFVARLVKASSDIGKELDSLADVISFGLLPTAIVYYIVKLIILQANPSFLVMNASFTEILILATPLFIVAFSALRLAKFNIDTRQSYGFIGVPTPATAVLVSSFPFIIESGSWGAFLLMKLYVIIPLILILSFLMVSEIPMMSLKFKTYRFSDNLYKYLLLIISAISLVVGGVTSIPVIFLVYIIFSFIQNKAK